MTRVDLHCHLLPGIDDGPPDLAASLLMARDARADGRRAIVCTPHVRADWPTDVHELGERVEQLEFALARCGLHLDLRTGAELGTDVLDRLDDHELELVAQGPHGHRWLLVETPWTGLAHAVEPIEEVRARGFGVVLAHPERAPEGPTAEARAILEQLHASGVVLQVDLGSLRGEFGAVAEGWAVELLRAGRVGAIATDAHRAGAPIRFDGRALVARLARHAPALVVAHLVTRAPQLLLRWGLRSDAPDRVHA